METLTTIVDIATALTVGGVVTIISSGIDVVVTLLGADPYVLEALCDAQGGTYEPMPHGEIVCHDGQWSALVGLEATPLTSTKGQ